MKTKSLLCVLERLNNMEGIREKAEFYRALYRNGVITREEAKENIMPYLDLVNKKAKEIAKKYNQKPKKVNFSSYVR